MLTLFNTVFQDKVLEEAVRGQYTDEEWNAMSSQERDEKIANAKAEQHFDGGTFSLTPMLDNFLHSISRLLRELIDAMSCFLTRWGLFGMSVDPKLVHPENTRCCSQKALYFLGEPAWFDRHVFKHCEK